MEEEKYFILIMMIVTLKLRKSSAQQLQKKATKKGKGMDRTVVLTGTVCPCPDFEGARPCLVARSDRATSLPLYAWMLKRRPVLNRSGPVFGPHPSPNSVFCPVRSGPGPMNTPKWLKDFVDKLLIGGSDIL